MEPSETRPLSATAGCGAEAIEGSMDGCMLQDTIKTGEVQEYTFVVPPRTASKPFSILLTAKAIGGRVDMVAIGPGSVFQEHMMFRLVGGIEGHTAMTETYIRIHGQQLKAGTWRIRMFCRTSDRKATIYSVRVQTPLMSTRLVAPEKTALARLVSQCCDVRRSIQMGAPNVELCANVLPNAVAVKTDASSDICQVGPFMCTPEGRLQKLMLGGAWLSCPAFPAVISEFEALHTIEFEVATFGGDTFANAAKVLAPLKDLERLYFRSTDLGGAVPCDLVKGKDKLMILDLSDSMASGQLPDCILGSPSIEELYLTRTRMSGGLPDTIPSGSRLRVLYAWNVHPDTGRPWPNGHFTGPLPSTLSNAVGLTNLVLPHHQLTGDVPALPQGLDWLDLKGNSIATMPGTLPKSLRILDLSDNGAVGALPDFAETSLAWVNLTSNRISGPLPATWGGSARTLSVLCIGNNSLAGDLDGTDWRMELLEMLDLSHNQITGVIAPDLAALPWLSFVNLAENKIGGTLDEFAAALPDPRTRRRRQRRRVLLSAGAYNEAAQLRRRLLRDGPEPEPEPAAEPEPEARQQRGAKPAAASPAAAPAGRVNYYHSAKSPKPAPPPTGDADADRQSGDEPAAAAPQPRAPRAASDAPQPQPQSKVAPSKEAPAPAAAPAAAAGDGAGAQRDAAPQQVATVSRAAGGTRGPVDAAAAQRMWAPPLDTPRRGIALPPMAPIDPFKAPAERAPASRGVYLGSKITFLDFSNNKLEGSLPMGLQKLGVFQWVHDSPPDQQLFHYLFLDNNDIWSQIPSYMLDAIAIPAEYNPCRCSVYLDLTNTTRFCPTRATIDTLSRGTLESLVTAGLPELSCLRSDFSTASLRGYLGDPAGYMSAVPTAPPSRGRTEARRPTGPAGMAAPSGSGGGGGGGDGGGGGGLKPAAIAGIVVGAFVAAAVLGGLVFMVARPYFQERRATSFFKTTELDHHPQIAINSAEATEGGWGRTSGSGGGVALAADGAKGAI